MSLSPAAVDVLDDMVEEWLDRDRHGELNGNYGYGPKKSEAFSLIHTQVRAAWKARVNYADVEESSE
ncbi:hypothetical protein OG247_17955 [Streptomyces sp. NBC_01244]|nr:hypothetical protein OG247_17955 [Streptomyces sp. NBC_01244]